MKTQDVLRVVGNTTLAELAGGLTRQNGVSPETASTIARKLHEAITKEMPDANLADLMAGGVAFIMMLALETAEDLEERMAEIEAKKAN